MNERTHEALQRLESALQAEDEDLIMELEGVDRITARFMIAVGSGRISGDIVEPFTNLARPAEEHRSAPAK